MELGANFKGASGSDGIMDVWTSGSALNHSFPVPAGWEQVSVPSLAGRCWARGWVQPVGSRMEPWRGPGRALGLECCVTVTAGLSLRPQVFAFIFSDSVLI